MSEPFLQTEEALKKRFNRLGQKINTELGLWQMPLRFKLFNSRTAGTVWRLENTSTEYARRLHTDMSALLATAADEGAELQFRFSEHWFRKGKSLQFRSSNLRFAIITSEPHSQPLYFRLEWAARLPDITGVYLFAGKGAAHPHWQFDGNLRALALDQSGISPGEFVDVELKPDEQVFDLESNVQTASAITTASSVAGVIPWFHRLHLPARAMWADQTCLMPDEAEPQQHEPADTQEVDNWIVSALRYMRHEFMQYSA